jgi:hypothetical protein
MGITPSWTKSWSVSDNGGALYGQDLQNIQTNIGTALAKAYDLTAANTFTGSGIPYRTIVLTPGGAIVPSSSGATKTTTDGTNLSYQTLDYSNSVTQSAYWTFRIPSSLTGTTAIVNVVWATTAGSASQVVGFKISSAGYTDNETLDAALGTAVEVDDTWQANSKVHVTTTGTLTHGWVADDLCVVKLQRDITVPAGTQIAGTVSVLAVIIEWQANLSSD